MVHAGRNRNDQRPIAIGAKTSFIARYVAGTVGIDPNRGDVREAQIRYGGRRLGFLVARAEMLCFADFFNATPVQDDHQIAQAFANRQSNLQVRGEGIVRRVLSDDTQGRRHQRFILALASGQTLLVAHNIDIAPRIEGLRQGDTVAFYGEYEWNDRGGVIHWTHHDPDGRHADGWLKHDGVTYQ